MLLETFILLKRRDRTKNLRLRVGGGMGPSDEPFVESLRERLRSQGCLDDAEFFPNLDRPAKQSFLRSLTVMSAPALYGEAFGLYVIEAMASGVPSSNPGMPPYSAGGNRRGAVVRAQRLRVGRSDRRAAFPARTGTGAR